MIKKILLIVPPFYYANFPSANTGTLQALLKKSGFAVETVYANVLYKSKISFSLYEGLATRYKYLDVSEFVFAPYAFPGARKKHEQYQKMLEQENNPLAAPIREAREKAGPFLEELSAEIEEKKPDCIFIESSFKQLCASLAIAARLKERNPGLITIAGGSSFLGRTGKALTGLAGYVDYFLAGFNEYTLLKLLPEARPTQHPVLIDCPAVDDMDSLPFPDYDDYFQTLEKLWMNRMPRSVAIETSRGCRWGEKSHCIFCGHHDEHLRYFRKSPERAGKEFEHLIAKYDPRIIVGRDAIIPDEYYEKLLPGLSIPKKVRKIFYEVKPDISLEKVRLLAEKNFKIQSGLESFNNRLLKILKKGQTPARNIVFLKNCLRAGVSVYWNFLYAIPGETEADYADMIEHIFPYITHLQPPGDVRPMVLQRFSPAYEQAASFGIKKLEPYRVYHYIFPEGAPVEDLALYFTGEYAGAFDNRVVKEQFFNALNTWRSLWQQEVKPELKIVSHTQDTWMITDTRQPEEPVRFEISREELTILERLGDTPGKKEDSRAFTGLVERGLLIKAGKNYISVINLNITS